MKKKKEAEWKNCTSTSSHNASNDIIDRQMNSKDDDDDDDDNDDNDDNDDDDEILVNIDVFSYLNFFWVLVAALWLIY